MTNAKEEFIGHTSEVKSKVKAVAIYTADWEPSIKDCLKVGYTEEDFNSFLKRLDFKYNSGYGGQELYGMIWYEDGTWSERGEYDGSEWWDYRAVPSIPEELS